MNAPFVVRTTVVVPLAALLGAVAWLLHAPAWAGATPWTAEALVARALERSDLIRSAQASVTAHAAGADVAGAFADPELEIEGGSRMESEGGARASGPHVAARLAIRFDPPGARALRRSVGRGDVAAARVALDQVRAETATEVLRRGLRLAAATRETAALRLRADRMASAAGLLADRPAATPAVLVERRTLDLAVARARARAEHAEGERYDAWLELEELVHLHAEEPPPLSFSLPRDVPVPDLEPLRARAEREAFVIRTLVAEAERDASRAALVRRERWPAVTLAPFVSRTAGLGEETMVGLGLGLPLPVFGAARGLAASAAAAGEATRLRLEHTRHVASHHVEHLHGRLLAALRRAAALPLGGLEEIEATAEFADRQFRLGRLPLPTLLAAHDQAAEAVEESVHAHLDAAEAWLDLELAAGRPGVLP